MDAITNFNSLSEQEYTVFQKAVKTEIEPNQVSYQLSIEDTIERKIDYLESTGLGDFGDLRSEIAEIKAEIVALQTNTPKIRDGYLVISKEEKEYLLNLKIKSLASAAICSAFTSQAVRDFVKDSETANLLDIIERLFKLNLVNVFANTKAILASDGLSPVHSTMGLMLHPESNKTVPMRVIANDKMKAELQRLNQELEQAAYIALRVVVVGKSSAIDEKGS